MDTPKTTEKTPNTAKLEVEIITLENNIRNLKAVVNALTYCSDDLPNNACRCMEVVNQELERQIDFITGVIIPDLRNEV